VFIPKASCCKSRPYLWTTATCVI